MYSVYRTAFSDPEQRQQREGTFPTYAEAREYVERHGGGACTIRCGGASDLSPRERASVEAIREIHNNLRLGTISASYARQQIRALREEHGEIRYAVINTAVAA